MYFFLGSQSFFSISGNLSVRLFANGILIRLKNNAKGIAIITSMTKNGIKNLFLGALMFKAIRTSISKRDLLWPLLFETKLFKLLV